MVLLLKAKHAESTSNHDGQPWYGSHDAQQNARWEKESPP
jgi:hypothetical protein